MRRPAQPLAFSLVTVAAAAAVLLPSGAASAAAATVTKPAPLHATGAIQSKIKVPARVRIGIRAILPAAVDLRSGAPAVGNQGQVGSCVSWSIGYSLAGYYARKISANGAPYAPMYLYMRTVVGTPGPNGGSYPATAMRNTQSEGIDTQAHYSQGTTNYTDGPTTAQIANAANYRITGWTTLFSGTQSGVTAQTALKQSLAAGTPVSITLPVYSTFDRINSMTPYVTGGTYRGSHEVTAYGYDAKGLIIRNSWGSWWGSGGDATLSWAFVNSKVNGAYTMAGVTDRGQTVVNVPTVTALSAPKAVAGSTVTITGMNLAEATSVMFGSESATFTNVTASGGGAALAVLVPAHAALGTADVTVINSAGASIASAASKFTYLPPAPTLAALAPATANTVVATPVTVTGSNLAGATVMVGTAKVAARNITPTSLVFTAPLHAAGSVAVSVTTAGGTASTFLTYVTPPAPVLTAVAPASGSMVAATTAVATGANFDAIRSVTANGKVVKFTKTSPTTLSVTMPAHAAGPVALLVVSPAGTSSAVTFTYVAPPAPTVSALSVASVATKTATAVTITGTSFLGTVTATVDGKKATVVRLSETRVRVTAAAHAAGPVSVVVTAAGGSTTPVTLTYV